MFEAMETESIKSNILSYLEHWSTEEGSFADSLVAPIAYEIWKCFQQMDALFPLLCLDADSGEYIIKRCADYGVYRREGTKAAGQVLLTGTAGTSLPAGTVFTKDGLLFTLDTAAVLADAAVSAGVTAESAGKAYNLAEGDILVPLSAVSGLSGIAAAEDFEGGTDTESTEEMRQRLLYILQKTPASGNAADYKVWATTVPGVQNAIVTPLKDGPGTVEVILIGEDNTAVGDAVLEEARAYIEAQRPIGATVTVKSCEAAEINIAVELLAEDGVLLRTIQTQIEENIKTYFATFDGDTIYYSRITQLCMNADGVKNIASLTINGAEEDEALSYYQVPKLKGIEVTQV